MGAGRWIGRGDKNAADQAAVDAMRAMLDTVVMTGTVVIGEGEKDEAPMLYNGEQVGEGGGPEVDVAVDPLEGTRLTALGQPHAIAVIAVAEPGATGRRARGGRARSTGSTAMRRRRRTSRRSRKPRAAGSPTSASWCWSAT